MLFSLHSWRGEISNLIEIQYQQNVAYGDIRNKLMEDGFNEILKKKA